MGGEGSVAMNDQAKFKSNEFFSQVFLLLEWLLSKTTEPSLLSYLVHTYDVGGGNGFMPLPRALV